MNQGKLCATLLTDLSKASYCIVHDFLIAKLEACVSHAKSLKLLTITLQIRSIELK